MCSMSSYLRATGKERLDVDVGVVNFEVMVTEPAGHTDGRQHPSLENIQLDFLYVFI